MAVNLIKRNIAISFAKVLNGKLKERLELRGYLLSCSTENLKKPIELQKNSANKETHNNFNFS